MEDLSILKDEEIIKLFKTSYFLETTRNFIRCDKKTHATIEIINKKDMEYLYGRYYKLSIKE